MNKKCTKCGNIYPATTEFFYVDKEQNLLSWCKQCRLNYQNEYNNNHKEAQTKRHKKWYDKNINKKLKDVRNWYCKNKKYKNNYFKQYQSNNLNKFKLYTKKRNKLKPHSISQKEWDYCLNYFDYCCAYCGINSEEHLQQYGQQLHKDHAYNNGANTINNCIPCCKSCNSIKHTNDWDVWYTPDNILYNPMKHLRIKWWLEL